MIKLTWAVPEGTQKIRVFHGAHHERGGLELVVELAPDVTAWANPTELTGHGPSGTAYSLFFVGANKRVDITIRYQMHDGVVSDFTYTSTGDAQAERL